MLQFKGSTMLPNLHKALKSPWQVFDTVEEAREAATNWIGAPVEIWHVDLKVLGKIDEIPAHG